jgi:prepilin-type N-terminal cleavage/methylation domain-containing protein
MKPCRTKNAGFTLVEIMTVVGIIGMLVTLALPNLIRARSTSQTRICITNLPKIESIKQKLGIEHAKTLSEIPTAHSIPPSSYRKRCLFVRPAWRRDFRALNENATCTVAGHTL